MPTRDEAVDLAASALEAHPMLLDYSLDDRLLIAGALAVRVVSALDNAGLLAADLPDGQPALGLRLPRGSPRGDQQ